MLLLMQFGVVCVTAIPDNELELLMAFFVLLRAADGAGEGQGFRVCRDAS